MEKSRIEGLTQPVIALSSWRSESAWVHRGEDIYLPSSKELRYVTCHATKQNFPETSTALLRIPVLN